MAKKNLEAAIGFVQRAEAVHIDLDFANLLAAARFASVIIKLPAKRTFTTRC